MGLFGKKKAKEEEAAALAATAQLASYEIFAVLAAAVAAYEAETYTQSLYVRKLNRTAGVRPAWSATGTSEAIDVRRI